MWRAGPRLLDVTQTNDIITEMSGDELQAREPSQANRLLFKYRTRGRIMHRPETNAERSCFKCMSNSVRETRYRHGRRMKEREGWEEILPTLEVRK